ncbi:MAG: hypothetical protein MI923_04800 [Phycisphaerales bacterium]|nr:hypothetical protein [Phycisphaerales bacterium]
MYQDGGTTVVRKRMGLLSVMVIGVTAIIVTSVISASGIVIYGLKVFDRKADNLGELVSEAARSLPELRESLPPALTDAFNDVRKPDYLEQLDVAVRLPKTAQTRENGCYGPSRRAVVEITNRGDAVVSLLSMRVVGSDPGGDPIFERNTWAATPLQISDEDWRGPLLPHETRRFPVFIRVYGEVSEVSHEITDIRIWQGETSAAQADLSVAETASVDF